MLPTLNPDPCDAHGSWRRRAPEPLNATFGVAGRREGGHKRHLLPVERERPKRSRTGHCIATEGEDYPVALFFPPGGDPGSLVNVSGAAILESSKNKEAGQKFIEYLLARNAQTFFANETKEYPLAAGVEPDPELEPLDQVKHPDVDLADLSDLQGSVKLIQDAGAL